MLIVDGLTSELGQDEERGRESAQMGGGAPGQGVQQVYIQSVMTWLHRVRLVSVENAWYIVRTHT